MPCSPEILPRIRLYVRKLFRRYIACSASIAESESLDHQALTGSPTRPPEPNEGKQYCQIDTPSTSLVCDFCWEGLFAQGPFQGAWTLQKTPHPGFSQKTTWEQVEVSSHRGCQWCTLVLATRTPEAAHQETVRVTIRFRVSSTNNGETPEGIQMMVLVIDGKPHSSYYIYTSRDNPAAPFIVARDRLLQLNSSYAIAMAQESLMNCIRNHQQCSTAHVSILPTRVIDCLDPRNLKLYVSNGEQAPYVALSYVWGEPQSHRTTTENVDAYLRRIDSSLLPQTIKDAIECTHAFGHRYLWIDSLCILQDSEEDKAREISQMCSIYRHAYFTIIAASAPKVGAGFLQERPPPSSDEVTLPFRCPDGSVGTMSLSPVWRQYDGSTEPVNQRAWCLQERLLSPRALVYASHTLQFHCQTSIVNVGNAVCGPMLGQRLPEMLFRPDSRIPSPLSSRDLKMLRWAWIETVGDYSQRAITEPGDKLVAFAAVPELFARAWKSEYLAGLWRRSLTQDLLWHTNFETRFARPSKYRAPSWSWAAVDGHILASSMDDRLDPQSGETRGCDILGCDVLLATPLLPYGKVSSGMLSVRVAMVKATWNPESSMPDLYLPIDLAPEAPQDVLFPHVSPVAQAERMHIGCAYPDAVEDVLEIWAVPVLWNELRQYAAGLIVTRAGEGDQYRRVGYFHSPEDSPAGLSWMLSQDRREIVVV
ncbi:HET-domain-containing protein [Dichomitus squalens LYAD-421 SS1]|uniref:HET-domain-containing protein n=1 Tax=Dichomitus squalens (strain LYAD-421) TaxID=732165 RepID=R7SP34_DICSQ|nr:HET-domain-containing protein [Dichomitus squalens LYAD-421 SS1]EJF57964.1 HET-domain-containing protein [Dichomitus squalens LYAD-421 SS1]